MRQQRHASRATTRMAAARAAVDWTVWPASGAERPVHFGQRAGAAGRADAGYREAMFVS